MRKNSEERHPLQVDGETYVLLLQLRNDYSTKLKKNVSFAWLIKDMTRERAQPTPQETLTSTPCAQCGASMYLSGAVYHCHRCGRKVRVIGNIRTILAVGNVRSRP